MFPINRSLPTLEVESTRKPALAAGRQIHEPSTPLIEETRTFHAYQSEFQPGVSVYQPESSS